jgi:hypothetical protein
VIDIARDWGSMSTIFTRVSWFTDRWQSVRVTGSGGWILSTKQTSRRRSRM